MNRIEWNRKAIKQLRRIPRNQQVRIINVVEKLATFPKAENMDIKPLTNHAQQFRLRIGNYRVLFNHEQALKVVKIEEVKKRDERTY